MHRKRGQRTVAVILAAAAFLVVILPMRHERAVQAQPGLREAYTLADTWDGTVGQSPVGMLYNPAGIDLGDGVLYVVDRGNDRVQRFKLTKELDVVMGGPGNGPGELSDPHDVAATADRVFVTDTGNRRIVVYDLAGNPVGAWSDPTMTEPWGIAVAGNRAYVSSPAQSAIFVFQDGAVVDRWDGLGQPRGVSVGNDGRVYVADSGSNLIRILTAAGATERTVDTQLPAWDVAVDETNDFWVLRRDAILWYKAGSGRSDTALYYSGFQGIAVSSKAGVFGSVANDARQDHSIITYAWRTRDREVVDAWRLLAYPSGRLNEPNAIQAGHDGRLWVADAWPRVQSFDTDGRPAVEHVVPEPAVDMVATSDGTVIVGETRRLVRVMPDGSISGSVRLARGTTNYWLTAMDLSDDDSRVSILDSSLLRIREYGITSTLRDLNPIDGLRLDVAEAWQLYWDVVSPEPNTSQRYYVANRTTGDVEVYEAGNHVDTWDIDGTAIRLAAGPDGSIFVLTLDGLVWKHAPDGTVVAAWDAGAFSAGASEVVDLTVDRDGRVYTLDRLARTVRVWTIDPDANPEPPLRRGGSCRLSGDKRASPGSVRLGNEVTVRLEVGGSCPQQADRADIMLVIDRSYTMVQNNGITATLSAARTFINSTDFSRDRVGVISFNSAPEVQQALTSDRQAALAALDRIYPLGGTSIALAFDKAALELARDGRPGAQPVVILLTDGRDRVPDDAIAAARAAKSGGVRIFTIGFGDIDPMLMVLSATAPEDAYYAPDTTGLEEIYQEIAKRISASVLATSMTIVDTLPADMLYRGVVAGPTPQTQGSTLTWDLTDIPFAGWSVAYNVEPQALGHHNTNTSAEADFVDGLSKPGQLTFPIPAVDVLAENPTATATPTRIPSPTATPRPSRLFLPITLWQKCQSEEVHADVALVLDSSGSMNEPVPSGGTKLEASILAARQFVQQLTFPGDRAAIVSFNTDATIEQPLTEDREALLAALDRISTSPGTRIDRGIDRGREALTETLADRNRVMILLTDGRSDNVTDEDVLAAADFAKGENILIFTIGLGTNVDPIILQAIASRPEYYYPAPDASQLANIYDAIVYTLPCVNLTWP